MAPLLVITGPPGAGKTTAAKSVAGTFDKSALVEGDSFFGFLASGAIAPWLPEAHFQNEAVVRVAAGAAGQFASAGYVTIFDGIIGPWFLQTFAVATGLDTLHYAVLMPSIETCVERVATRVDHGFTDEAATRHMFGEFASAAIEPRHVLTEPPDHPDGVVRQVLSAFEEGLLLYRVPT
jgi:predicted ABC-type ATPase